MIEASKEVSKKPRNPKESGDNNKTLQWLTLIFTLVSGIANFALQYHNNQLNNELQKANHELDKIQKTTTIRESIITNYKRILDLYIKY